MAYYFAKRFQIRCDGRKCRTLIDKYDDRPMDVLFYALEAGWSLDNTRQLCPRHRRLNDAKTRL